MNKFPFFLLVISIALFSCGVNEKDLYYSVVKTQNSMLNREKSTTEYYCKVVNRDSIKKIFFIDNDGLFLEYQYSKSIEEISEGVFGLYKDRMPYEHRMYFLGDSVIQDRAKKELIRVNRNRINPCKEHYLETENQKILRVSSEIKRVTFQSMNCLIKGYKDSIVLQINIIDNGGIYFVSSFEVNAVPVKDKEKVVIDSLLESNSIN